MGVVKDVVVIGGAATAGVVGVLWYLNRNKGPGDGKWGLFGGGYKGGTVKGGGPESGPLDQDGGDGGTGNEPSKGGDKGKGGSGGKTGEDGKGVSSGGSSGQTGSGKGGDGKGEGKTKEGAGGDGSGGKGGGSGGGIGQGQGAGSGHDQGDTSGDGDTDEGGGAGQVFDPYAGWGGAIIEGDLPAPDISEPKLEAIGNTVYQLVGNQTTSTQLPPPLHQYNPNFGIDLTFWADVALHSHYSLPPGRLDPEIDSHRPWIELWIFILDLVIRAEAELNDDFDDIIDDDFVGDWIPYPDDQEA